MSIEKKASLVCVVVLAVLFGIGLANREPQRLAPAEDPLDAKELARQRMTDAAKKLRQVKPPRHDDVVYRNGPVDHVDKVPPARDSIEVQPVAFRVVKVRPGDNFSRIAARELGSAQKYPLLMLANPKLAARRMQIGSPVRIPMVVGGKKTLAVVTDSGQREGSVALHRAKNGETLSGIAKRYYGKASQWRKIMAANRNQLRRPESLRAGMRLSIPH